MVSASSEDVAMSFVVRKREGGGEEGEGAEGEEKAGED